MYSLVQTVDFKHEKFKIFLTTIFLILIKTNVVKLSLKIIFSVVMVALLLNVLSHATNHNTNF